MIVPDSGSLSLILRTISLATSKTMATLQTLPPHTTPLFLSGQAQAGHPTGVDDNKRVLLTSLKKHLWLTPPQGVGVDEAVVDGVEAVAVEVVGKQHNRCIYKELNKTRCRRSGLNPVV